MSAPHPFAWDDPDLDGTDGAHPAYWRGQDAATQALCRSLLRALLCGSTRAGAYAYGPLNVLRAALAELHDAPHATRADVVLRARCALAAVAPELYRSILGLD